MIQKVIFFQLFIYYNINSETSEMLNTLTSAITQMKKEFNRDTRSLKTRFLAAA